MNPKDVAKLITEDPDVLHEDYCSACGGWDKAQGGSGHKLGCPAGKPGTSIGPPEIDQFDWDAFITNIENLEYSLSDFDYLTHTIKTIPLLTKEPVATPFDLSKELEAAIKARAQEEATKAGNDEYEYSSEPSGYYGSFKSIAFAINWTEVEVVDEIYVEQQLPDGRMELGVTFVVPCIVGKWRTDSVV